jgi:hypothetical protein
MTTLTMDKCEISVSLFSAFAAAFPRNCRQLVTTLGAYGVRFFANTLGHRLFEKFGMQLLPLPPRRCLQ